MAETKTLVIDKRYYCPWGRYRSGVEIKDDQHEEGYRPAVYIYRANPVDKEYYEKNKDDLRSKFKETYIPITCSDVHVIVEEGVDWVVTIGDCGYITLANSVKTIKHLAKCNFGDYCAPINVPEYQLPLRIDFESPVPPKVKRVDDGSIEFAELRVPAGALDAYAKHKKWGKAAYIMDADGNVIDNYAERHKKRLEDLRRAEEEKLAATKQAKVAEMAAKVHEMIGPMKLAKWNPTNIETEEYIGEETFFATIQVQNMTLQVQVPTSAQPAVWDAIVARLEQLDK